MRKLMGLMVVLGSLLLIVSGAMATTYDVYGTYNDHLNSPGEYDQHSLDLTTDGYTLGTNITDADLWLTFSDYNHRHDEYNLKLSSGTAFQTSNFTIEGDGSYSITGTVEAQLETTGILTVKVSWADGDFYWKGAHLQAVTDDCSSVPEPASLLLLGLGMVGLGGMRKFKK